MNLFWNESFTADLVNHLWQSTAMVVIAWLLALALRKNHARVRYWVWFGASLKFLLPFSLLVSAGEWIRTLVVIPASGTAGAAAVIAKFVQPYAPAEVLDAGTAPAAAHHPNWLVISLAAIWGLGVLRFTIRFARGWWRAHSAKRAATPVKIAVEVPALCTRARMEPGIFGIFRPVLMLPEGILEKLSSAQLHTILAHEMCHARRRDNLTFALHQVVQALFWFHPAVWWIGTRLIEERERACDEAVVQSNGSAETYAEGILNVCRFYVESPAACVAGVTGADLKQRIVRIMTGQAARNLSPSRKLLLGAFCSLALAAPVLAGLAWAGQQPAQEKTADTTQAPPFDVISVKPHKDEGMNMRMAFMFKPDGVSTDGMPVDELLRFGFHVSADRLLNEPDWAKSSRYDIEAKVAAEDALKLKALSSEERSAMLIPILQDRFGLKFHRETREMEVYTLTVAKGGPKLKEATPDELAAAASPEDSGKPGAADRPKKGQMMMRGSPQGFTLDVTASNLSGLVRILSQQIGKTVVDKTGLTGSYDYTLTFTPDDANMAMLGPAKGAGPDGGGQTQDPVGPSVFTALQEQLGLKLVPQKQQVDVIVIDHIEQPSAN